MKLNYDCIRDCLLVLENKLRLDEELAFNSIVGVEIETELGEKYDLPTIIYSLIKLEEVDYIQASIIWSNNRVQFVNVSDITYEGHDFLNSIRPQTVWEKTKHILSNVGCASFSIVNQIATPLLSDFIRTQANL